MSKLLAIALTALLMAAAFFLPAQLSHWNDRLLLDEPHIFQEEEREGFARSVGLTVAEKVLLLRGGNLDSLNLTEGELRATFSNSEGELRATFSTDKDAVYAVGPAATPSANGRSGSPPSRRRCAASRSWGPCPPCGARTATSSAWTAARSSMWTGTPR